MYISSKKNKKDYYSNINPKTITDNKKFWKTVKPLFSKDTITLVENDEIFQNEQLLAEKFNEFFSTAVTKLKIRINSNIIIRNIVDTDPISRAIAKYSAHPSILKINEVYHHENRESFSFQHTTYENVYLQI